MRRIFMRLTATFLKIETRSVVFGLESEMQPLAPATEKNLLGSEAMSFIAAQAVRFGVSCVLVVDDTVTVVSVQLTLQLVRGLQVGGGEGVVVVVLELGGAGGDCVTVFDELVVVPLVLVQLLELERQRLLFGVVVVVVVTRTTVVVSVSVRQELPIRLSAS